MNIVKLSKTKSIVLSASALLLVFGTPLVSSADDAGWYMGLGISALDADFDDVVALHPTMAEELVLLR